jgi:hypothetical protein
MHEPIRDQSYHIVVGMPRCATQQNSARKTASGHFRRTGSDAGAGLCPHTSDRVRTFAPQECCTAAGSAELANSPARW